jgi:hypothetical protein
MSTFSDDLIPDTHHKFCLHLSPAVVDQQITEFFFPLGSSAETSESGSTVSSGTSAVVTLQLLDVPRLTLFCCQ